ncbi:MAG: hypothetical protein MJZ10_14275 [Fibrobacter sp.]|nr:hypothetical protein [Fibrobacter sp.]
MQNQITTAIIIALAAAFITAAATCQCTKSRGDKRTKEAQENAEEWENKARSYAETLERAEEARRRAEQSTQEYFESIESAEEKANEARQSVEELRKSNSDCEWLDERLPDGVRDVIRELYKRPDCN